MEAHALWAPSYDSNPNPILSLEARTVESLLPAMEGRVVLDVACGTGRWLERLRRGASLAVGMDLSDEMLNQARTKPLIASRLIKGDALALPLREKSIDFAICSFGLSYVTNIRRFAEEIERVLQDDGVLVLSDFHPAAEVRGWKRSFRHQGDVVEIVSVSRPIEQIQEAFAQEGFDPAALLEASFGEAERPIFEVCGRAALFEELLGQIAIYVSVFRKERRKTPFPG